MGEEKMRGIRKKQGEPGLAEVMSGALYFHGCVPRWQVERVLEREGDWLVLEETGPEGFPASVVAVRRPASEGVAYFRLCLSADGRFHSEFSAACPEGFDCAESLLAHYRQKHRLLVTDSINPPPAPRRPIAHPRWLLYPNMLEPHPSASEAQDASFGQLHHLRLQPESPALDVAVKECLHPTERDALFLEGLHTLRAQCPYVVRMHGMVTFYPSLRLVQEYHPLGDLAAYVRNKAPNLGIWQLIKFVADVGTAVAHLSSLQLIHLDVAAHSCLVKEEEEGDGVLRAVLGQFRLCRAGPEAQLEPSTATAISARWAAPEVLAAEPSASAQSDVWSLGVLMWEVFSAGELPYSQLASSDVPAYLESGQRLLFPADLPDALVAVLNDLWSADPLCRPTPRSLSTALNKALASQPKDSP